ncbi:MAG: hypothetical protein KTR35_24885 [Gammaproteobacteria bacterium]|nr:hypothetical protein [Gammaproteobacteria bacterium]
MRNKTKKIINKLWIAAVVVGYLSCANLSFADFVQESDRPDRSWLAQFRDAQRIKVTGSLQDAINQCPGNQSCELLIDQLELESTVFLNRSKTRITGTSNNRIRWQPTANTSGFYIQIESNVSNIIIDNLNIDGDAIMRKPDVFGIGAYGESIRNVLISNNRISNLSGEKNAHGIAIYGTGRTEQEAIRHIIIEKNTLSALKTGSSEAIAINGNVRNWEISKNKIADVTNIAIDAIGGEGTSPTTMGSNNRVLPGSLDAARLGFIEHNRISYVSTKDNPAYNNTETWAAAIYIDGGRSILIRNNQLSQAPWGIEVGAENCVGTAYIQVIDNNSSQMVYGDLLLGGYAKKDYRTHDDINCDPKRSVDAEEGHGYVSRVVTANNNLDSKPVLNDRQESQFIANTVLQHRVEKSTITSPFIQLAH